MFDALSESQLRQVLAVEIEKVESRLTHATGKEIKLRLSDRAATFLLEEGADSRYGARHLKRALEKHLVFSFSSLIATGQMDSAGTLNIGFDTQSRKLTFCQQRFSG